MPFKLRLKKSRHYNVISKSLFVISVELLDGTTIECSLSAESLGSSCLDYVCQRLGLQQPEFFGLCYTSRHNVSQWIELDIPLKKQLDKYARDMNLYLRVMYYVNGVSLLHDETTRYHYFLQVKKDVIEGRMSCTVEEAVRLASFSMQAEFGDHDVERHTAEYLRDFVIFPQHIIETSPTHLFELVVRQHASLVGLPQAAAEERYILLAQQLDGYGQETFEARDSNRNKALICVSLIGILIGLEQPQSYKNFPWREISNVIIHKKNFIVECQTPDENMQLEFPELETVKYVWKLCILQHKFFTQYVQASDNAFSGKDINSSIEPQPNLNKFYNQTGVSLDNLDSVTQYSKNPAISGLAGNCSSVWDENKSGDMPIRARSTSCLNLSADHQNEIGRLRSLLPSYRPAPDYDTAVQRKCMQPPSPQNQHPPHPLPQARPIYSSQPEIHQTHLHEAMGYPHHRYPDVTQIYVETEANSPANAFQNYSTNELDKMENHLLASLQLLQLCKAPPPYRDTSRPNSNSTPDLASQTSHKPHLTTVINPLMSGSSPDLVSSRHFSTYPDNLSHNSAHRTYTNLAALSQPEPIYENIPLPWSAQNRNNNVSHTTNDQTTTVNNQNLIMSQQSASVTAANNNNNIKNINHKTIVTVSSGMSNSNKSIIGSNATTLGGSSTSPPTINSLSSQDGNANASNGNVSVSFDSSADQSATSVDSTTKMRTWKRWGLLVKGKSNTLQKTRPKNQVSRDHPHRWSTGLPRLPLPPTVSKETMCQLLERKLVDSQLFNEFEKIPKRRANLDVTTAQLPENSQFNRYKDVLPYEENRVRLTPTRDNKTGYVNASRISATVGTNQRFYVAAQGPLANTIDQFWQCIWETDVYLVVRLTSQMEEGNFIYLPNSSDHCLRLQEFQIWKEFSQETGHCITSRLRINHVKARRSRSIWHLQYTKWGEQGCPADPQHFLGFLEELNSVRQHTTEDIPAGHNRNPPVLVHCTAGVGRSGVTIVCDILLHTLEHNQEVDIPRVVASLRHQRMLMVQTLAQYRFIYSLLITYLKQSRLI